MSSSNKVITLYRECGGAGFHGSAIGGDRYMYVCGHPLHLLWEFPRLVDKINMVLSKRKHAKAYMVEVSGRFDSTKVTVTLSDGKRRYFFLTVDAARALRTFGTPCWVRLEYEHQ